MGSKTEAVAEAIEAKGGPEWLWERLASMSELEDIAKELGCTVRALYRWRDESEERQAEWGQCLMVSADLYAADGKKILDHLHKISTQERAQRLESAAVALAQARANQRMKIAAARNPAAWGERPVVQVSTQVNFGMLHLDALKAKGSMTLVAKPVEPLALGTGEE